MKKRLIRIASWVLALCLCLTMLPATMPEANAASNIVINGIDIGYANGSYFTKNGSTCKDNNNYHSDGTAKATCHNRNGYDCSRTTDPSCNCMRYWPTGLASTCQVDLKASQCFGFARYCQWRVYGTYDANSPSSFSDLTGDIYSSSCTGAYLKQKLRNCAPATHLRTFSSVKGYGHSICIIDATDYGVNFADCNSDGCCKVRYVTMSWDELATYVKGYGGVDYANSYKNAVPPTSHTVDTSYGTNFTAYPKAKITAENIFNENHSQISSTSWIGPSDKCTIHEVYTDGCCKVTYPLDAGGTKTVYSKISLFNIQANITPKISCWISYDKMGDKITSAKQGDWVYLCFRMYDANSGSNLNDVAPNKDYSVTETIYKPDGTVAHTYTYSKSDNNWIGAGCYTAGTYSYKVEVSGGWSGTYTGTFVVQENPKKINVSSNNVNLTLGGQATSAISVWSTGYYDGSTVLYFSRSNSNISCSWGDWKDGKVPLTITANAVGTTTLTIGVKDSDSGTVLDTTTVTITVACSGHSYSYSVTTKPTTSSTGKLTGTCSKCSGTTTITLPKLNTTDYSYAVKTAATCTATGTGRYTWKTTTYGSFYFDVTIAAKGHSYTNKVTAPTCTAQGYTTHTCSCGYSYKDTYTNATGHSYSYKVTKTPTTGATGTLTSTCSKCKGTTTVTLPKLNSTDYSYTVKTTATCTATGIGRYTWKTTTYGSFYFDVTIAAKGHSYTSKVTAPTCTKEGYTTYTCSVCKHSYTGNTVPATGNHTYVDGKCSSCGQAKPVVKPTLTVTSIGLSLKDEVIYNVYFTASDISDVVEMGLLGFNTQNENGTYNNADYITPGYTTSGQYYIVHSNGISAKNLSDNYYYKVYAKLSDGTYVCSSMKSYNAVKYANTVLGNASTNAKLKAAVVAMLNYGAAAQVQFGYKTDALMNAGLTAEQKALVRAYDESMVNAVLSVDSNKAGEFATKYASARSVGISLKGAFAINYYLTASMTVDSGMTLYYWTQADYQAATKLTTANATGSVTMEATGGTNQFKAAVEGISAKQIDKTIFVIGVYESNGVTYSTGVLAYSLGKYCAQQAAGSNAALAAMAQATAVYGYYAKAYFGN